MSIRQRTGQLLFWLFCGEWLLLQRRWLSPSTIALLTLLVLARVWLLQTVALVPYYRYAGLVVAVVAIVRYCKSLSLATRRQRAHYNVPPWGLPWTSFLIGPRPVPSALGSKLIEPLTAFVVSGALVALDRVVLPPLASLVALTHLPALAPWDTWIHLHPIDAAQCAIYTPVFMFSLHNFAE